MNIESQYRLKCIDYPYCLAKDCCLLNKTFNAIERASKSILSRQNTHIHTQTPILRVCIASAQPAAEKCESWHANGRGIKKQQTAKIKVKNQKTLIILNSLFYQHCL